MTGKKRLVVTGMGVVTSLGNDVDSFYQQLLEGKSAVAPITQFPVDDYPTRFAASIHDFDPGEYIDKKTARRVDPFIAYGIVAGKKALEQAGGVDQLDPARCGVLIGSGMGGMNMFSGCVENLVTKGIRRVSPFFVPYTITNMAGALLAIEYGFRGPNYSISTACATGTNTIVNAAQHIESGEADFMICGGVEAPIIPMGLAGFCACKALSTRNDAPQKASRPWDQERDGFVMGEGGGVIVLETLEHAKARGATILAEYLGGALSCDAYHMTDPDPSGLGVTECLNKAIANAGIESSDIDYVNAHGTSTPVGDMAEVNALKKVLKDPSSVVMNSTKSMIGHALGAAGGIEAIVTIKALQEGIVHPTINLENPEPDLAFHVPQHAEKHPIKVGISNSFGFGGHNATVIFRKY